MEEASPASRYLAGNYVDRNQSDQADVITLINRDGTVREFRTWLTYSRDDEIRTLVERSGSSVELENPYLSDHEYGFPAGDLGLVARKIG